jgi:glycosyltransferase involved in cell wall biosynthesis
VVSSQRVDRALWPPAQRHALRVTDRLVDGIVVNCEFLRRHLRDDEKTPAGLIHLCYNGIDTGAFQPANGAGRMPCETLAGGGGGVRLRPEKGLDTLLDAFAAVRGLVPGMKLAIVGSGPCLADLQDRARALGVLPDCVFEPATPQRGRLAARHRHLRTAVAFRSALQFADGGHGLRLLRWPPRASAAIPELVAHGETGVLFEPRDAAGLAQVLRLLVRDPCVRSELASNAASLIHSRFSLASGRAENG